MDFQLTAEQLQIKELAADFARRVIAPRVKEYDRNEYLPIDILKEMGRLGLMGGVIPEVYGGAGMSYMTQTVLIEELARTCHVMAAMASLPSGLAGSGILQYGTEEQKQKYLAPFARGEVLAGAAVTEPGSGTDVAGMQTTVRRDGPDYILTGAKMWISNLDHGEWFLTFAQMDRSRKHKGICAFIVERNWPGVEVHPIKNKVGFRPIATGEVAFQDVRVPAQNRVGEEGQGFEVAMCAVENGRLGVAARAVGIMQDCLDLSLGYAQERETFGQSIGRYQLIQNKLAEMAMAVESARLLTYRLACLKDQGETRTRMASSLAKCYATDALMKVAVDAAQVFGAYACSDEYPVSRHFRDAKFFQVVEGTNEIHRVLIAETLLGYRRG